MCLLDTFRTPSPCSHVPYSYAPAAKRGVATQSTDSVTTNFEFHVCVSSKVQAGTAPQADAQPPPCLCATRPSWPPVLPAPPAPCHSRTVPHLFPTARSRPARECSAHNRSHQRVRTSSAPLTRGARAQVCPCACVVATGSTVSPATGR